MIHLLEVVWLKFERSALFHSRVTSPGGTYWQL